ncbi:MAG: GntR family transcriptional regulator [Eubacterium sp.]|nr:GntR family transcriptional regulator [Eubacterium sp.]MCI8858491.1 GntR family transcriptional regulator [Lachnospiraceae bacterium]
MPWNLTSDRPIFAQIIEIMQLNIVSGKYTPGDKLPSVRELATEAAVNPNTMQKALSELERSGLVYSKRTSGRFITEDLNRIEGVKATLAGEKIKSFLQSMQSLGFDKEETISLINQTLETMKGDTP